MGTTLQGLRTHNSRDALARQDGEGVVEYRARVHETLRKGTIQMKATYGDHQFFPNDTVVVSLTAALALLRETGSTKAVAIRLGNDVVHMRQNELVDCLEVCLTARAPESEG